jgi:transcriptional regulator with XRE-family HTH domain
MKRAKQKKLEKRGWSVGTVVEFLSLTPEEAAFIEIKLALSDALRAQRQTAKPSQAQVAKLLGSSQSCVAKMEAGDPSVTLDLLIRSLLALGATKKTVARTIEAASLPHAAWAGWARLAAPSPQRTATMERERCSSGAALADPGIYDGYRGNVVATLRGGIRLDSTKTAGSRITGRAIGDWTDRAARSRSGGLLQPILDLIDAGYGAGLVLVPAGRATHADGPDHLVSGTDRHAASHRKQLIDVAKAC